MQRRTYWNVLEIECGPFAGINRFLTRLGQRFGFGIGFLGRHLNHILIGSLITRCISVTLDGNFDMRATTYGRLGHNRLHRCRKIQRIQTLRQVGRQIGVIDIDQHHAALVRHLGVGTGTAEADQYATFTVGASAKIDIGNRRTIHRRRKRLGRIDGGNRGDGLIRSAVIDGQQQAVTFDASAVGRFTHQLDHDASAAASGYRRDARSRTLPDVQMPCGCVISVGKINRYTGRIARRKYLWLRHRPVTEVHLQLDVAPRQSLVADVLQRGACCQSGAGPAGAGKQQTYQYVVTRMAHDTAPKGLDWIGHSISPCIPIARQGRCWRDVPSSHHYR